MKRSNLDWFALVLVVIGALNWGLVVFNFNLVTALFGSWSWLVKTIYTLVGLSGLYMIYMLSQE